MSRFKSAFSVLTLLFLGLTLTGEAFGDSKHFVACESSSFASSSDASFFASSIQQHSDKENQEQQSDRCNDPCHLGQCHFGHCSFPSFYSQVPFQDFELKDPSRPFLQIAIESPDLEGLRRPPRNS